MGYRGQVQFQQPLPPSFAVKWLMIINTVVWFVGVVIVEQYFLKEPYITLYLGLEPFRFVKDFFLWQPFTYLFIHATSPLHLIFNMLLLYWVGSSLERLWGTRFFLLFYFVSGVGAGILYSLAAFIYTLSTGHPEILVTPVIGASAALFGCLVAYGIYFGEQLVYFMFFFPMKARYFTIFLGAIEVIMVLNNGPVQGKVANLAHVGGIITGYIFIKVWPFINRGGRGQSQGSSRRTKLRLVVNNDEQAKDDKPKYWN